MRTRLAILLIPLAMVLGGCTASFSTTIGDRAVTGTSACFSSAQFEASGDAPKVTLGGKTVQVAVNQITWAGGGRLELPAKWSRLDLQESLDSIVVRVDGRKLAAIWPGAARSRRS